MSKYDDIIVWVDRRQAKIFHLGATEDVKLVIMHMSARRRHHAADHEDSTPHALDTTYLQSIAQSLGQSGGILITGPGNSKFELQRYIDQQYPESTARISGVEVIDNPDDAVILETARRFFRSRGHRHQVEPGYDARKNDSASP
jgi:stalled ribosome rescue protein Dom34